VHACAGGMRNGLRAARKGQKAAEQESIGMKRFHVHVRVEDLEASVKFYGVLFGAEPSVRKADYAKWMLDEPKINFAISAGSAVSAIDHLGFEVEADSELEAIAARLRAAGAAVEEQRNAACCYARGNKGWVEDPSGILWETFHTLGESTVYGNDRVPRPEAADRADAGVCCTPAPSSATMCCSAAKAE
jgi:catechol 2,3-dioxygenase-like lactoylglutathione lyase family enzyme